MGTACCTEQQIDFQREVSTKDISPEANAYDISDLGCLSPISPSNKFKLDHSSFTVFDADNLNSKDVSCNPRGSDLTPINEQEFALEIEKYGEKIENYSLDFSQEQVLENLMSEQDEFLVDFTEHSMASGNKIN